MPSSIALPLASPTALTSAAPSARRLSERKRDTSSLRPHIGNANITFGNPLSRRNWDKECIAALARQTVPYAVAPMTSVQSYDGKRLASGQEVRPTEHFSALNGDRDVQLRRLIEGGFVLAKETP